MKLGDRVVDGIFLERPNRYLARVEVDGQEIKAHVPDPGRLPGLMIPGRRVFDSLTILVPNEKLTTVWF